MLRHSTAHVLAQAVCRLWPGTKLGIGPTIADGFYYDLAIPTHVSADDLPKLEETMRAIVAEDHPFVREEVDRDEALRRLTDQPFKTEIVEGLGADEASGDIDGCARRPPASTATTAGRTSASVRTCPRPAVSGRSP